MPLGKSPSHQNIVINEIVARAEESLANISFVRACVEALARLHGHQRAQFATSVLVLNLALRGEGRAQKELASHVHVFIEAFHQPELATQWIEASSFLAKQWSRIRPIVEYFEKEKAEPSIEVVEECDDFDEITEEVEQSFVDSTSEPPPLPSKLDSKPPSASFSLPSATKDFWKYAEQNLGRAPNLKRPLVGSQSFAVARNTDRSQLLRLADEIATRFPHIPHARVLVSLIRLYVAGQQKERGLLGNLNRERLDILREGLSFLGDSPEIAGQVAVLFENDGPLTRQAFEVVVEITCSFLSFCSKHSLDPRQPEAVIRFTSA